MNFVKLVRENPQAAIKKLMQLPITSFFNALSYKSIVYAGLSFTFLFGLQLKLSRRARQWTKSLVHLIFYGFTFAGLILIALIYLIKLRVDAKKKKEALDISCSESSSATD